VDRKKVAWIISRIFDPVFLIPILLGVAVWYAVANGMRWRFLGLLMFVDAFLPFALMMIGLKLKWFSDWDITKRKERGSLFFWTLACHFFGVCLAFALGKTLLFEILLIFWTLAVIFAVVTLFWKISVHAGVNGAFLAFFNHFYGWDKYWWLVLILFVVMWSRVFLKKHTWKQVILGSSVAIAWVSFLLAYFAI
jgi:membrane-associated phospholipid phosphatase